MKPTKKLDNNKKDISLPEFSIPECLHEELGLLVKNIDARVVCSYAKAYADEFRGFQINTKGVDKLRVKIFTRLKKGVGFDTLLNDILRMESPAGALTSTLSAAGFMHLKDCLAALYGTKTLALALLLDPSKVFNEYGKKLVAENFPEPAMTKEEAADSLFYGLFNIKFEGEAFSPESEEIAKQSKKELKEANRLLSMANKSLVDLKNRNEKNEKDLETQKAANKLLKSEVQAAKEEAASARKELSGIQGHIEKQISAGVKSALSSVASRWLDLPVKVKEKVEAIKNIDGTKDILAEARKAIEKQAMIDEHSGNVRKLRERLEALREALAAVTTARAEAIKPISDLAKVSDKLTSEIREIEKMLVEPYKDNSVSTLFARVNESVKIEELSYYAHTVRTMVKAGLLDKEVVRKSQELIKNSWLRITAKAPRSIGIHSALEGKDHAHMLLDGHNALFLLPEFAAEFDGENPGRRARGKLAERVNGLLNQCETLQATIFFDSSEANVLAHSDKVQIAFSGGKGEHRADDAILTKISHMRSTQPLILPIVVTDDRGLAAKAMTYGAETVSLGLFSTLL